MHLAVLLVRGVSSLVKTSDGCSSAELTVNSTCMQPLVLGTWYLVLLQNLQLKVLVRNPWWLSGAWDLPGICFSPVSWSNPVTRVSNGSGAVQI